MAEMENLSTVYTQPTLHHVVWVFLSHCHGLRSTGLIQPFRFYPLAIYRWPPPPPTLLNSIQDCLDRTFVPLNVRQIKWTTFMCTWTSQDNGGLLIETADTEPVSEYCFSEISTFKYLFFKRIIYFLTTSCRFYIYSLVNKQWPLLSLK